MLSISEIDRFLNSTPDNDRAAFKEYYDKCHDNLKGLNKRSNQITVFLLLLLTFYGFSSYIKEAEFLGIKVENLKIIARLTPLLFSYFLLEWCLIAKRRRSLIILMKPLGSKIFGYTNTASESVFSNLSEFSLNAIPFSFMMETLNINHQSRFSRLMFKLFFIFSFLGVPIFVLTITIYSAFNTEFSIPFLICNLISVYCLSWVVYFYINDFELVYRTFGLESGVPKGKYLKKYFLNIFAIWK